MFEPIAARDMSMSGGYPRFRETSKGMHMGMESESIPAREEIALGQIATELGLTSSADSSSIIRAIRQLKVLAASDSADGNFLYWSVQHGNGGTSETTDEATARSKYERWREANPDDRIELVRIVGVPVDGQNLDVEYDVNGRRLGGAASKPQP